MQEQWNIGPKIIHEIWCEKIRKNENGGRRCSRRAPQKHSNFKDPTEVIYLKKKYSNRKK